MSLMGRILNGLSHPIANGPGLGYYCRSFANPPPDPLKRTPITDQLVTRIRSLDRYTILRRRLKNRDSCSSRRWEQYFTLDAVR